MAATNPQDASQDASQESKSPETLSPTTTTTIDASHQILVTGAAGQIGTELLIELRKRYGNDNIIGTGRKTRPSSILTDPNSAHFGPFLMNIDITDLNCIQSIFEQYPNITTIYHLAAVLSGDGEKNPQRCWNVNMNGTIILLEYLRLERNNYYTTIMIPSSIAVFGNDAPKILCPNDCILHPTTMYGITKVSCELICEYYNNKYNNIMTIRGLRLPGIISYMALPGGGTTDYAVSIFYQGLEKGKFECYIGKDVQLPLMYMKDCLEAMINLTEYKGKLDRYTDFNVGAFSISPKELIEQMREYDEYKNMEIVYNEDFRSDIAKSWCDSLDDSEARKQWGWEPKYGVKEMVKDMIQQLKKRKEETGSYYPVVEEVQDVE